MHWGYNGRAFWMNYGMSFRCICALKCEVNTCLLLSIDLCPIGIAVCLTKPIIIFLQCEKLIDYIYIQNTVCVHRFIAATNWLTEYRFNFVQETDQPLATTDFLIFSNSKQVKYLVPGQNSFWPLSLCSSLCTYIALNNYPFFMMIVLAPRSPLGNTAVISELVAT